MNAPRTFIFIGRSGCGKGTQAALLLEELRQRDPAIPQLYLETGKSFRAFAEKENYTSSLVKKFLASSERLPDYLAVWNWSELLIEKYTGQEHVVIDGAPRSRLEAEMITTAFQFYGLINPVVINLDVSVAWSRERLLKRGRSDDQTLAEIDRRLAWFETEVVPALEYFKQTPFFHFVQINGERPVEVIQQEILKLL